MAASSQVVDRVVRTFEEAAHANVRTPCRQGNVIELTTAVADDVLVTADLHGHRVNFEKLCAIADLQHQPCRHLIMQEVCHGGPLYPSQHGCLSHTMLEDVAQLKVDYPDRFHFLLSNHELAEVTDYPIMKANKLLNLMFRGGLQTMYGSAADRVREAATRFLRCCPLAVRLCCPLAVRLPHGVFISHSAPEKLDEQPFDDTVFQRPLTPADIQQGGDVFRMVWGRDFRQENARRFAEIVAADVLIHGHEPCQRGFKTPNDIQIILDSCNRHGSYVMLPVGEKLTQGQIVERITRL